MPCERHALAYAPHEIFIMYIYCQKCDTMEFFSKVRTCLRFESRSKGSVLGLCHEKRINAYLEKSFKGKIMVVAYMHVLLPSNPGLGCYRATRRETGHPEALP